MVPDDYHDFFLAEAGAAGALVGLLFVAISVAPERVIGDQAKIIEEARASTALTALLAPLTIALVSLLPGADIGIPSMVVSAAGLLSILATLRRYFSIDKPNRENPRGLLGLSGAALVLCIILGYGVVCEIHPSDTNAVGTIAGATIASLLLGVDRAWALIGGRGRGRASMLRDIVRGEQPDTHVDGSAAGGSADG